MSVEVLAPSWIVDELIEELDAYKEVVRKFQRQMDKVRFLNLNPEDLARVRDAVQEFTDVCNDEANSSAPTRNHVLVVSRREYEDIRGRDEHHARMCETVDLPKTCSSDQVLEAVKILKRLAFD